MVWEYNTELFAETTIEAMKEDYSYILDAIIADLECSVSSITLPRLAARRSNPSLANPSAALASRRPRPAARVSEGRDPVLETLVDIWKEVLGEETFGVHDNFFDLGGHSLSLIKIASRIFDAFGVRLDYRTLMGADTVLAQAEAVETARTRSNRRLDA
jgi:acyl carrier protein